MRSENVVMQENSGLRVSKAIGAFFLIMFASLAFATWVGIKIAEYVARWIGT